MLEQLVETDLDFVFKGGTTLILLIDKPERFSIDIDIITEHSKDEVKYSIEKMMNKGLFKRFAEKERKDLGIPKAHYYFYYDSVVNGRETFVMLDVLFDSHSYPVIVNTPIKSHWIKTGESDINVKTPDIDSILGDKLTVFAPNTTGIPFNIGKAMENIKQLFDIDRLFNRIKSIQTVEKSFNQTARKELSYRKLDCCISDVLNDIIEVCLLVSRFIVIKRNDIPAALELFEGLKRFKSFPIVVKYRIDDAVLSSAKTAYLAASLIKGNKILETYSGDVKIVDMIFPDEYKHLAKLKKRSPEAYYYWCKTIMILEEIG